MAPSHQIVGRYSNGARYEGGFGWDPAAEIDNEEIFPGDEPLLQFRGCDSGNRQLLQHPAPLQKFPADPRCEERGNQE